MTSKFLRFFRRDKVVSLMPVHPIRQAILVRKPELKDDDRMRGTAPLYAVASLLDEHFSIPERWGLQSPDMTPFILNRYYPIERAG